MTTPALDKDFRFTEMKFIHLRYFDYVGCLGYRLVISNLGGTTIAYVEVDGSFIYAVAKCSRKDNFSRKTGRTIAGLRLMDRSLLARKTAASIEEVLNAHENNDHSDWVLSRK